MKLPETNPVDDPEGLWALQLELLMRAEYTLGSRDPSKKICDSRFVDDGPHIRNSPNMDAAWVELSRNGENYWPTAVFEMAHETVHLLNPIAGNANYLEEGVAVEFSLGVQSSYGVSVQTSMKSYLCALQLVRMLPGNPLEAGRLVRERVGALSDATVPDLTELFPSVDETVLCKLTEEFDRNMA
ncbi:MAG: hypothetical protein OXD46_04235 [Chloroflexi bacterium]|nr:hypothetical protein [Chloroflexota bacterium]